MGFFRNLYREAREIVGLKAPAENETQLAERLCGELKSELGGKKTQEGQDWKLTTTQAGRNVEILFEAAGQRALFTIGSTLEGGPTFFLQFDPSGGKEAAPKGVTRIAVAGGVFVEGSKSEADTQNAMWKGLGTNARATLSGLVTKHQGVFGYDEGAFKFAPETQTLLGPSAKYNVKSLLTTLMKVVEETETAWNDL